MKGDYPPPPSTEYGGGGGLFFLGGGCSLEHENTKAHTFLCIEASLFVPINPFPVLQDKFLQLIYLVMVYIANSMN